MATPSYELADGESRNAEYPGTFPIPPRDERTSVAEGDIVKLVFEGSDHAERMWVIVTGVERHDGDTFYVGELNNHPVALDLVAGDIVAFGPEHIVSIWR